MVSLDFFFSLKSYTGIFKILILKLKKWFWLDVGNDIFSYAIVPGIAKPFCYDPSANEWQDIY